MWDLILQKILLLYVDEIRAMLLLLSGWEVRGINIFANFVSYLKIMTYGGIMIGVQQERKF